MQQQIGRLIPCVVASMTETEFRGMEAADGIAQQIPQGLQFRRLGGGGEKHVGKSLVSARQEQSLQRASINILQRVQIRQCDILVDLMDAGVDRPEFYDLWTNLRYETAIRCAAGGGKRGFPTAVLTNRFG